jgi:hypothetical protein
MKILHSDIVAQLENDNFVFAELIEFQLDTPIFLTTASYDIVTSTLTSNGNQTYLAQGKFISYSGVRQTDEFRVNNVAIQLSGSTDTFVNMVLQDRYLHRTINIYKIWININTGQQIQSPNLIYSGTITAGDVLDNSNECQVTITTSNEFYDFDRQTGRQTNDGSQKKFYPNDNGMIFSTSTISDIRWGKT